MSKKALLIGINYIGTNIELKGCINDINCISNALKKMNYSCTILTEQNDIKPTKNNIINQLKLIIANSKPGDTIIFYYSGHGSQIKDTDNDEEDKLDEVLVPLDYRTQGIITDDELFSLITLQPCTNFYGFTDCCHSGTMCDLKYNVIPNCKLKKGIITNGMKYNSIDWTDDFIKSTLKKEKLNGKIVFISGCKDNQVSMELNKQGAFTYCFLQFLNNYSKITFTTLLKYLQCNLQINRFIQVPQLSSNVNVENSYFIL